MKINKITLSFPEKEEKLFLKNYFFDSILQFRIAFALLIILYSGFGFLDALMFPEYSKIFHIIRYLFVVPLLSVVLLLSFTKVFRKLWQLLLFLCFVIAGTGISIMIIFVPENFAYYGGLMLVFSAGYFFIKLRFFLASLAGWTTLILFNLGAIFYAHIPDAILINYNFFFISANVIGMFAAYNIEHYARRNFSLNLELENEKLNIEQINKNLEQVVEERTKELLLAKATAEINNANVTAIIEGTQDSIWAFDRDYEIIYINQTFQKEFHQTFGAWLEPGINLIDSLPEALRPIWKPRYDRVLNQEHFTIEEMLDTESGKIYIRTSFNPIVKSGKVVGGSCFGSNITNRKLAEIELQKAKQKAEESEENIRQLTENIEQVFWLTDWKTKKLLYVSPSYEKVFGMNLESAYTDLTSWKKVILADDYERVSLLYAESAKEEKYVEAEYRILAEDGTIKWIFDRSYPIRDNAGNVYKFVSIAEDITKRKEAEEEVLRQLSEKETLLKEVQHRIKNNIASIESLLLLQAASTENSEVKTALQESRARIQSTRVLYEKLLISKDYQEISIKNYTNGLLDSIVAVFSDSKNISIQREIMDFSISSKKAIPVGIIINELMTNIFKYAFYNMDEGHIKIEIIKSDNLVILSIKDNGVGIAKRIGVNKSPGFGLTIVKMLAQQLKGTYSIKNNNGTKSVLKFDL
ncbi:MAG: PAS domain S-box protein [Candidatus Cloacimonadales bacterium]